MSRNIVLAALFAGLTLSAGATAPAKAQGYEVTFGFGAPGYVEIDQRDRNDGRWGEREDGRWGASRMLPPRAIVGSLYRRGFSDIDIKRRRGDSYIVEATGRRGNRVLAVVDGRTTEITGLKVIEHRRPYRMSDDGGWDRPWSDGGWDRPASWGGPRW